MKNLSLSQRVGRLSHLILSNVYDVCFLKEQVSVEGAKKEKKHKIPHGRNSTKIQKHNH